MHCLPARGLNAPKWPWSNRGWLDETLCVAHSMGSNKLHNALWERSSLHQNACAECASKSGCVKKRKRKARRTIIRQRRSATSDHTTELCADVCLSQITVASKGRLPFTSVSAHCLHCSFVWFASICISNRNKKRWAPVAQSPLRRSVVHFWLPDVQLEDPQPRAGESMRSAYTPHGRKHYGSGGC